MLRSKLYLYSVVLPYYTGLSVFFGSIVGSGYYVPVYIPIVTEHLPPTLVHVRADNTVFIVVFVVCVVPVAVTGESVERTRTLGFIHNVA